MSGVRRTYDWEAIREEYRTGRFSLNELSRRHGPGRATIQKRAVKEGWEKDLSDQVRQRTREKISRATLPPEALEAYESLGDAEQALVEHAADENAAVVKGHRKLLTHWRGLLTQYSSQLTEQTRKPTRTVINRATGEPTEVDLELDYVGKCMNYGTQALEKVIKLERQSYGLDQEDDDDLKTFEELMREVAPRDDTA